MNAVYGRHSELVKVGAVGPHPVLIELSRKLHPRTVFLRDLPVTVCADGANGLTRVGAARARQLGLHPPPGAESMPLAAYHSADWGPRALWRPAGRGPLGLDAPESGGRSPTDAWGWLLINGQPYVQPEGAPAPGYYLSTTALQDQAYELTDPRRYFDAAALPGWVLPGRDLRRYGVDLGDLALIEHGPFRVWAQAFDAGNTGKMLELSIAACEALGIPDCARSGGVPSGVDITILPGSRIWLRNAAGSDMPGTAQEIERAGRTAGAAVGLPGVD